MVAEVYALMAGCVALSRVGPSYTVSSRDTAPAVCAIVDVPSTPLLVYGTIITYDGDRGLCGQSKWNDEQHISITAHEHDWRRIRALYPHVPMVAAGDFDATGDERNSPTIKTCTMLRDALHASRLVCATRSHWIDHICLSAELAGGVTVAEPWQQLYTDECGNGLKRVSDHQGEYVIVQL